MCEGTVWLVMETGEIRTCKTYNLAYSLIGPTDDKINKKKKEATRLKREFQL